MTADPTLAELERLLVKALPLIECARRLNTPHGERERLVGFVIDQDLIGLGLSEPLFALDALADVAKALPSLIAREKALREALELIADGTAFREQRFAEDNDPDYFLRTQRNVQLGARAALNGASHDR